MAYDSPNLDLLQPVPEGPARVSYPWSQYGDRDSVLVEQVYRQRIGAWRPAVLNTPIDPTELLTGDDWTPPERLSESILVEETEPQAIGNGMVEWIRVWAAKPRGELILDGAAIPYQFPGIADSVGNAYGVRRPIALYTAAVERATWYTTGAGGDYDDPDDIPVELAFAPFLTGFGPVDYVQDGGVGILATFPTRSQYLAQVTAGTPIVVSSSLSRWRGNLWVVSRTTVKSR